MKSVLVALIKGYQVVLSSVLGPRCRFYPSCSHYAVEAIETHGAVKGAALTCQRICKCHPFHPGGYDPVPLLGSEEESEAKYQEGSA